MCTKRMFVNHKTSVTYKFCGIINCGYDTFVYTVFLLFLYFTYAAIDLMNAVKLSNALNTLYYYTPVQQSCCGVYTGFPFRRARFLEHNIPFRVSISVFICTSPMPLSGSLVILGFKNQILCFLQFLFLNLVIRCQMISYIYSPTQILIHGRGILVDHWSTISSLTISDLQLIWTLINKQVT